MSSGVSTSGTPSRSPRNAWRRSTQREEPHAEPPALDRQAELPERAAEHLHGRAEAPVADVHDAGDGHGQRVEWVDVGEALGQGQRSPALPGVVCVGDGEPKQGVRVSGCEGQRALQVADALLLPALEPHHDEPEHEVSLGRVGVESERRLGVPTGRDEILVRSRSDVGALEQREAEPRQKGRARAGRLDAAFEQRESRARLRPG